MTIISKHFDPETVEWRRVFDDTQTPRVDFEYSLLGYDLPSQRLDMLIKFAPDGHCRRHRHIASTMTVVLEGEQHLSEIQPDGSTKSIVRKKGEYALAPIDALMHDEWGGPEGGLLIYSMHAPTGVIFEYYDENLENPWSYSIEDFVNDWNSGAIYGWKSETPKAATG